MSEKFVKVGVTGLLTEQAAINQSTGAADANKIPATDANGRLHESFMPLGVGVPTKVIAASEALTAPCLVNIHNSTGQKVRYADATTAAAGRAAHGFILQSVASGANATVYFEGEISGLSGLTPGVPLFLGATNGTLTPTPPTTTGHCLQVVGVATSPTTADFEKAAPIIRG